MYRGKQGWGSSSVVEHVLCIIRPWVPSLASLCLSISCVSLLGFPGGASGKSQRAGDVRGAGLISGSGRSP